MVDLINRQLGKLLIDFEQVTRQIEHRASKGRAREGEVAEELFRRYLPQSIGIGHGEVIATNGEVSNEADVVLYDAHGCPILLEKHGYQIFPVECVHGIVEVKSHLDSAELTDGFRKLSRVKRFPKTAYEEQTGPLRHYSRMYDQEWEYFPTVGIMFAYDSMDLRKVRERLDELHAGVPFQHRIDFVVVLKKGLVMNWNEETDQFVHTPSATTRLRAVESSNPLLLMVVFMQQLFQSARTPRFRILDYFRGTEYGRCIDP